MRRDIDRRLDRSRNQSQWSVAVQGPVRGVRYHCVAADAIGFRPLRIDTVVFPG